MWYSMYHWSTFFYQIQPWSTKWGGVQELLNFKIWSKSAVFRHAGVTVYTDQGEIWHIKARAIGLRWRAKFHPIAEGTGVDMVILPVLRRLSFVLMISSFLLIFQCNFVSVSYDITFPIITVTYLWEIKMVTHMTLNARHLGTGVICRLYRLVLTVFIVYMYNNFETELQWYGCWAPAFKNWSLDTDHALLLCDVYIIRGIRSTSCGRLAY